MQKPHLHLQWASLATCAGGVFLVPTSAFNNVHTWLAVPTPTAICTGGGFPFTNQAFTNVHTCTWVGFATGTVCGGGCIISLPLCCVTHWICKHYRLYWKAWFMNSGGLHDLIYFHPTKQKESCILYMCWWALSTEGWEDPVARVAGEVWLMGEIECTRLWGHVKGRVLGCCSTGRGLCWCMVEMIEWEFWALIFQEKLLV